MTQLELFETTSPLMDILNAVEAGSMTPDEAMGQLLRLGYTEGLVDQLVNLSRPKP